MARRAGTRPSDSCCRPARPARPADLSWTDAVTRRSQAKPEKPGKHRRTRFTPAYCNFLAAPLGREEKQVGGTHAMRKLKAARVPPLVVVFPLPLRDASPQACVCMSLRLRPPRLLEQKHRARICQRGYYSLPRENSAGPGGHERSSGLRLTSGGCQSQAQAWADLSKVHSGETEPAIVRLCGKPCC